MHRVREQRHGRDEQLRERRDAVDGDDVRYALLDDRDEDETEGERNDDLAELEQRDGGDDVATTRDDRLDRESAARTPDPSTSRAIGNSEYVTRLLNPT